MNPPPNEISIDQIEFGHRERSIYPFIPELAESIEDVGMLCPIILSPLPDNRFRLEDGGRRYRALESLGTKVLYHGTTGALGKPGYVLKEEVSTNEKAWLTELVANLHRESLPWQDELRLLFKAWKEYEKQQHLQGKRAYPATLGKMLGNYGYADVEAARQVHDEVLKDPERFKDCGTIMSAYVFMLKDNARLVAEELAKRALPTEKPSPVSVEFQSKEEGDSSPTPSIVEVPFSNHFLLGDSLEYMEKLPENCFDHIICDPDFAIDLDILQSNTETYSSGVVHSSPEDSLTTLRRLMPLAFKTLRTGGFFAFWYDLDHHEKLQQMVKSAGFTVQRWPITWHKLDYLSNAAPTFNFPKNQEWLMIARKSATLAKVQKTSVIALPGRGVSKEFNHPFAKPVDLWLRIYDALCMPGQTVWDPFMGAGSASVSAIRFGLIPSGCELQPQHYNTAVLNIQAEYKRKYSPSIVHFV